MVPAGAEIFCLARVAMISPMDTPLAARRSRSTRTLTSGLCSVRAGTLASKRNDQAYAGQTPLNRGLPCVTFIEKLCALVPPPRANLVTYHGVLAPNAAWRAWVVPDSAPAGILFSRKRCRKPPPEDAPASERKRRYTWAELMKRVFELDVLECPFCQGKRKLIALITDPPVVRAILECLDLPSDSPVLAPARRPP